MASSRVGARTMACGTTAAGRKRPSTISMSGAAVAPCFMILASAGRRKPQVFPEPVLAMAMTSLPLTARGHACAWMGVGDAYPCLSKAAMSFRGKGASWNLVIGSGVPSATTMACSSRYAATSSSVSLASPSLAAASAGTPGVPGRSTEASDSFGMSSPAAAAFLAFFAARFFAVFLAAASDSPSATAAARRSCATSSVDLRFFPAAGSFGCSTAATACAGSRPSASAALNAAARRALASAAAFCLAAFFNFLTS
mmetsp:Transcript_2263/g.5861  ORF Transcript_2263/g.5861 Transcript_2263/m.5861 type:complete len:255 (-) Transcript_2263:79-843(-)